MEDKEFFRITALIIALGLISLLIIQFVLAKETPAKLIIKPANDKKLLFFDVPALSYVTSLDVTAIPITPIDASGTALPKLTSYPAPYSYPAP